MSAPTLLWFRRDLRVRDHPALLAAAEVAADAAGSADAGVLGVFVVDPALAGASGAGRITALRRALTGLDAELDGRLLLAAGDPVEVIPRLAAEIGASEVHVSADHAPYGTRRDERVESVLAEQGARLVRTGSPYAVAPGRVLTAGGTPFKVFTPFRRAWFEHGWRAPARSDAGSARWLDPSEVPVAASGGGPAADVLDRLIPDAGGACTLPVTEDEARERWERFRDERLADYAGQRDRPGRDASSRLSAALKFGAVHPRTLLADLAALEPAREDSALAESRDVFASELAWREFYADVLFHRPETARENVDDRFGGYPWAAGPASREAEERAAFDAWRQGRTGYPIVDAGMRQLRAEGWMHNRVRMITASFLTKDLHVHWRHGARHFMELLADGDLASNQHGWQWTAGTGTDASPFFRVFNPVLQGERFDPDGAYVRRWVPELAEVEGKAVHRPRTDGLGGYPAPIVDHAQERRAALAQYEQTVKGTPRRDG